MESTLQGVPRRNGDGSPRAAEIERGADVNGTDYDGVTALHIACWLGNVEIFELLLARGANASQADNHGATAFHFAPGARLLRGVGI